VASQPLSEFSYSLYSQPIPPGTDDLSPQEPRRPRRPHCEPGARLAEPQYSSCYGKKGDAADARPGRDYKLV